MRIVLAAATAALLSLAVPAAHAADPATGEVNATKLTTSWSGVSYGYPFKAIPGTQTHEFCINPGCDSFTLTVKDAGHLKVNLVAPGSAQYVDVLVTKPDGSTEFLQGSDPGIEQEVIYKNAQNGTYFFDIWPNELPVAYNGQYNGTAELCTMEFSQCFLPPAEEEEEL
jgi:hypothetical protein